LGFFYFPSAGGGLDRTLNQGRNFSPGHENAWWFLFAFGQRRVGERRED
jgi:hypothetical protein